MPQQPPDLIDEPASFETLTGERFVVAVHFNPASLQYTVSNTLKDEGKGAKKKQYVSQTTAKLSMDLVFDTTDTGEDVRVTTDRMARLLQPVAAGKDKNVPPTVKFGWGPTPSPAWSSSTRRRSTSSPRAACPCAPRSISACRAGTWCSRAAPASRSRSTPPSAPSRW